MAFFPCIYFSCLSQMDLCWSATNNKRRDFKVANDDILERASNREKFFRIAVKMLATARMRGIRMIMENPWSMQSFLKSNFVMPPSLIDNDRSLRGDFFRKPTAYWYINCKPTEGMTIQKDKKVKGIINGEVRQSPEKGVCSEERSMISPDYARNFICDFILGKVQKGSQMSLF